jgi:soluble lytic murein transglycosylase-like protein
MGLVGYSAREIADVLNGHLTRADLDEALSRTMAGQPRTLVAAFLDSRWKDRAKTVAVLTPPSAPGSAAGPADELDADIDALAREHRVEPELVRAIIAVESGGNPRAVSSAGAIGLMQLMPRTAAALGVNPWQPAENLRGGIAYLAGLLRAYGEDIRLALIAYNAGPQHADLVRTGRAVAYRETQKYLEAIATRFRLP